MHYDRQPDATLVQYALDGDREAFSVLLSRHWPGVVRVCARLLGSTDGQDVAQEAALSAFLSIDRLQDPARFGAWLYGIAANLVRMALRRRRTLSLDALGGGVEALVIWPRDRSTPQEIAEARELHDTIIDALYELPPASREVAIGFFLDGYSYAELAALFGVPVATIKGRLFKGRRRLQHTLAAHIRQSTPRKKRQAKELTVSESPFIEVRIDSIRKGLYTEHRVIILRELNGSRILPIWVGAFEGDAIALALDGKQAERPMTHDLTLSLLAQLGAQVQRIMVNKLVTNTFYAEIEMTLGERIHIVDARPSDAIALAVRAGAPIFVASDVLEAAGMVEEEGTYEPPAAKPFHTTTFGYLSQLARTDDETIHHLPDVDLAQRFPAATVNWNAQQAVSVQLQSGEEPAWMILPPQVWKSIMTAVDELRAHEMKRQQLQEPE